MAGAISRAVLNSALTLRSLEPIHMSSTSAMPTGMKYRPSSPAKALAKNVLPQPGGPHSRRLLRRLWP